MRRPAGLPLGAITVRPSSRCFGHLHPTTLLWRIPAGFSDDQPATRDSATIVRQRHNVSARGNHSGSISSLGLLRSLPQPRQIHASDLRDAGRGGSAMPGYSGHTSRVSSHQKEPHLTMPLSAARVSIQDWQSVIEKVKQWLDGWKAHAIAGSHLVLNKAVLSIIPTFFFPSCRPQVPFGIGLLRVCADSSGEEPDKGMPEG